jgi:hypothetical protein
MAVRNLRENLDHAHSDRMADRCELSGETLRIQDRPYEWMRREILLPERVADRLPEQEILADRRMLIVAAVVEGFDEAIDPLRAEGPSHGVARVDDRCGKVCFPGRVQGSGEPAFVDESFEARDCDGIGEPRLQVRSRRTSVGEIVPQGAGDQDRLAAGIGDPSRPLDRIHCSEIDIAQGEAAR